MLRHTSLYTVFPTHVGMNQTSVASQWVEQECSPRMWG